MSWFEKLTGFDDEITGYDKTKNLLECDYKNHIIKSKVNNKEFYCGDLEIVSLNDLYHRLENCEKKENSLKVGEIISGIMELHKDINNKNSLFQVASQFNLLEMASHRLTPENGVKIYEYDFTQGPACAIACGAGTIYRNYFVKFDNQEGQTSAKQICCIDDLLTHLNLSKDFMDYYFNGYFLPSESLLEEINDKIIQNDFNFLKKLLKIGVQHDTEVTISSTGYRVSQIFCSALPLAYSKVREISLWEKFARLILEATYEATFCAAVLNYEKTGNNKLFLTLIGGGAFGNKISWITDAIKNCLYIFKDYPLSVNIVSRSESNKFLDELL